MDSKDVPNIGSNVPYRLDELGRLLKAPENWGCYDSTLLNCVETVTVNHWRNTELVTVCVKLTDGQLVTHTPAPKESHMRYRPYLLSAVRSGLHKAITKYAEQSMATIIMDWGSSE